MTPEIKKPKTAAELRQELDAAKGDLSETSARIETLEDGDLTEANVQALATANARSQILRGTIARIESEIPTVEADEAREEIVRLDAVFERESELAQKATDKLTDEVCKLLVPTVGSLPFWTDGFCKRRRHEINSFAQDFPSARRHTDKARDAATEKRRLEGMLRQ